MPTTRVAANAQAAEVENVAADAAIEETKVENQPVSEAPKKRRRGLSESRGTARLKFDERDIDQATHLFKGHLETVELAWATEKEDSGRASFAGLSVPSLVFTFASNAKDAIARKYVTLRFSPVESNALTIPGAADEWKVNQVFDYLKHILNVFVLKGKPMPEEMADALELPYEDFNEQMEYVPVEPEEVLAGWRVLFENFIAIMENNGKPVYKTAAGSYIPLWMKLLRFTKVKNAWKPIVSGNGAGDFGFNGFVGEGVIEIFDQTKAPVLHVDPTKESLIYRETAKAPIAPAIPGTPAAGGVYNPQVPAGAPVGGYGAAPMPASPAAATNPADDLPF